MNRIANSGTGQTLAADCGLYSVLAEWARTDPDRPVISRKGADGWQDVSCAELAAHVDAVAGVLLDRGVRHGDRVAVLGTTRYEWAVADLAVLSIGAVTVPIYPTASEHQVRHVLGDSGATWSVAEDAAYGDRLRAAGAGEVWSFAEIDAWRDVPADIDRIREPVRADDLATIVYTSGTTGLPKGCMLTHANMYASSANTVRQTDWLFRRASPDDSAPAATLLSLPLSHVFGRTILLSCLIAGTRTGLVAGVPEMLGELPGFRPTFLALVPYALEKIRKRARSVLADDAEAAAVATGLGATGPGGGDDRRADPSHQRVRDLLGGRLGYVICGGASLDDTTWGFYAGVGIEILNCYGLTEAATAVTVNAPATNRFGTVGRPIPGTTVAIADDGEVLVSGDNVSPGYWPAARAQAGTWLHTGDLGELDDDGFLRITGRSKEILVTSGGKNVAPTPLEDRIRLHPLVSNCMLLGDGRSHVTALVTLDAAAAAGWAAERGLGPVDEHLCRDPALLAEIGTAVDAANALVSRAESVRRFRVVARDFTVDAGHLTPSMKLRRAAIAEAYAADVAALYGNEISVA
ncbi:AMP-dependent synthetase/ligase [Pseudonocardia abyssalis]|uniref:AMP-dependent synthetase/ligase n=1 Tax=Pseudonocardia abyssalis TaxID=2792008 RepID=UPI001CF620EA|nr:AMP-dependent synthetase/ligase [Pseudonocardia abyssalis]